jgi:hypothetical protein
MDHLTEAPRPKLRRMAVRPIRVEISTISMSSCGRLVSATHHDKRQERILGPVSVASRIPNGQGRLRQPPVETVTR